jgi:glucose-1-phosphate thymidylyltransferase
MHAGIRDSLLDSSQFIAALERRQGLKVARPEEISFRSGWVDAAQLEQLAVQLPINGDGQYPMKMLQD